MERMISPDRALELVLSHVPAPRAVPSRVEDTLGRTLAQDILAPDDYPPFTRAMMDGFAVVTADAGSTALVIGEAAAGHTRRLRIEPGKCVEIMTGAICPPGTEAVVMVERVQRDGDRVVLPAAITAGQHVQQVGELCRKGTRTLSPGDRITPLVLGHLAALNRVEVMVYELPRVAIISTGDELVATGGTLREGQIRDSNGPMLIAQARDLGVTATLLHARDTQESLTDALAKALGADVVVLTGGVSMGKYDLVPRMVEAIGAEILFHKATQKPGKPLLFASGGGKLVFGLPGNARSAHFCFDRYVAPALRGWSGRKPIRIASNGRLTRPYAVESDRTLFVPMLAGSSDEGGWRLAPFDEHGSADIYNAARGNAYVRFEPGKHTLDAGTSLSFSWMGDGHG